MAFDEKIRIIVEAVGTGKAASDIKNLDDKMTSSGKAAQGWKKDLGQAGQFIGNNLPALAAGGAAAVGAFAVKAVGAFQDTALAAGKLADSTGLTVEAASRWNEVANDVGISGEQVGKSFGFLLKSIGKTPEAFRELGITAQDSNGQILQAIDLLNKTPEGAERAALGAKLFGRSWAEVSELVAKGADQVKVALDNVQESKVINESELGKARKFRDTMDALSDTIEGLTLTFGQFVIDGIGPTLAALGELAGKLDSVAQFAGGAGNAFGRIVSGLPVIGAIDNLNTVLDSNADGWDRVKAGISSIPGANYLPFLDYESAADKAARKVQELADAAKNVQQGFDPASRAAAGFVGDMSDAELAAAKTAAAQRDLADAAKQLAEKQAAAADAAKEHAEQLERINEAAGVQLDAFLTLPDAIDAQAEAFSDLADAMGDVNKEPTAANLAKVEENAKKLAAADVALAKATAESNNKTFSQKDALDVTNRSLLTQAANMQGPAKQAIFDRIAALNGIPKTVLSDIQAKINAGDIAGAEALLNKTSRSRDAAIRAEATNVAYTEQQLANLARNRTADIHAVYHGPTGGTPVLIGGRAGGGPVDAGTPYMVGESGRELFVPNVSGQVIDANQTARMLNGGIGGTGLGSSGGSTTVVNVSVTSADPQAVVAAIERYVYTSGNQRLRAVLS